ncbi:PRC-barrel domain-containing protein [Clostridium hydrogeniformans]|uniref:PRC-barrel domain-containing protein n=1 Tax=Clostridium hydrogeniformans TaxID=349933 RepID=UPI00048387A0|nr:PRC-barrel domain-containing protein [Clostridium hydrogeniformans]
MFRTKEFQYMKVETPKGKYLGFVKDIAIDYNNKTVIGFKISTPSIFSKEMYVLREDIICINERIIASRIVNSKYLCFNDIKFLDVITTRGCILGILEEVIIDPMDFSIKALVISLGFINKIIKGKELILIKDTILGDHNILYNPRENIKLFSIPHKIIGVKDYEEDCY